MSELWARLGLIAGALVVAYAVTLILRARAAGSPRRIATTRLAPGLYLFTSTACPDCRSARRKLGDSLGASGFVEMRWEEHPGIFHELGVTAVPATVIVEESRSATLYPGQPDRVISRLGP